MHPWHFLVPGPMQPEFRQCALASRYAVCSGEAPTAREMSAAVPSLFMDAYGSAPAFTNHLATATCLSHAAPISAVSPNEFL
jgi:hypothetical protein